MSELDEERLQGGLSRIATAAATGHTTHAFLAFTANHADLTGVALLLNYPYLQTINLAHNALESLAPLSGCSSLRHLDVSHNALATLLDFAPPRALRSVSYSHNNLAGALQSDALLANRYLEQIDLSVNRIEKLDGVGQLANLRSLCVARNQITSLEAVSCPALTALDASTNFIKELTTLPGRALANTLRTLQLDHNQINSLAGIERLALLTVLSLRDNDIAELEEVARLAACPQLVELDLRGCPLVAHLGATYRFQVVHLLPNLQRLDGAVVSAQEVVDAHNAHGADRTMREAITHLYLPQGNRTQPHMAPKPVAELVLGDNDAATAAGTPAAHALTMTAATAINVPSTVLPEEQYWSLLGERKFSGEWVEFLRVAKARIRELPLEGEEAAPQVLLDLEGVSLGEAGCWALSELLPARSNQIAQLNLNHTLHPLRWSTKLGDSYGQRRLLRSLTSLACLQSLSLSHCHLGREGGALLAGYLASPQGGSLRALHLQHNLLGQNITASPPGGEITVVHACPGLRAVLDALGGESKAKEPHALEYLNLSNNLIDQQGARAVADYLAGRVTTSATSGRGRGHRRALSVTVGEEEEEETTGDIRCDDDGDDCETGSPLQQQQQEEPSSSATLRPILLRTLLLDSNPLQDDGLVALAFSLRTNASLTSLSLRGHAESSMGVRGFEELCHSICKHNRTIAALDIGSNPGLFASGDDDLEQDEGEAAASGGVAENRAGVALSTLLFASTNGSNECGTNLLSLRMDNTGLTDGAVTAAAGALAQNRSLLALDISANARVTERGKAALFQALSRQNQAQNQGDVHGGLQSLRMGGMVLGAKSAMRLAEWLRHSALVQEVHVGHIARPAAVAAQRDEWGQVCSEAAQQSEDEFQAQLETQQQAAQDELSELVLSTLAGAISVARGRHLTRLSLGSLGPHVASVLDSLAAPLPAANAGNAASAATSPVRSTKSLASGTDSPSQADAIPARDLVAHMSSMFAGSLSALDLGGNTWDSHSLALLAQVVAETPSLTELLLHDSVVARETDAEAAFATLMAAVLSNPSLGTLSLAGTPLSPAALEGLGQAMLGPEGQGVPGAALQTLDLSFCSIDEFAQREEGGGDGAVPSSKFLRSLQCDSNGLTSLSLRGNDLPASECLRFLVALDANWNLRALDLGEVVLRQGEESMRVVRTALTHAVSHGLGSLALPSVKGAANAGAAGAAVRDSVVSAVADGWRSGVATGTSFLREHGRTPESVLHQLRLDVGASFRHGAPLSWQQKQRLLEAVRPLAQITTANRPSEESFRLVQLTAGAAPLRLNTQQHSVCGVDLVENALAARLACQRM